MQQSSNGPTFCCYAQVCKLVNSKIYDLEHAAKKLPPTFGSEYERRAFYTDLVQKLRETFKDLSTSREVPNENDAHLAVAARSYEMYKKFSEDLQGAVPDFLGEEYRRELEKMVKLTRGGSLSNFLSHPIFAHCVKEGFVTPLTQLSDELVTEVVEYISTTIRCLLELDAATGRRPSPVDGMGGVSVQLRQIILQKTLEFIKAREATCRVHLETRSKAEGFIFTLDSTYGKAIEDLKHDGEREDGQKWAFLRRVARTCLEHDKLQ